MASSWRGDPTRHQVGQTAAGQWWWFDPAEGPRVIAGVQGVNRSLGAEPIWPQLEDWGFNLLGPDTAEALRNRGGAYLHPLELRRTVGQPIYQHGVQLPDVFDPRWEETAEQHVNAVVPTASLAAYLSDSELAWGEAAVPGVALTRPTLLQVCLSLDPAFAAYHAAWEFVFAQRGGEFTRLTADWEVALPNKETLRQMTRDEKPLDSVGYRADLGRFTQQFAVRYFGGVRRILKAIDPGRLWLSAPLHPSTPEEVRVITAQHCDVILVSQIGLGKGLSPELWVEVDWAQGSGAEPPSEPVGVSALERMMRRGREQLVAAIRAPQVVGYLWGHYGDGDMAVDGPFTSGLFDEVGRVNHAHVQVLSSINYRAAALRATAQG